MGKFVSNRNETIRLFKNPFLEYFSHIHPMTPIFVYVPVIAITAYLSLEAAGFVSTLLSFVFGVFFWTLTEYVIHRWAFHYDPKSEIGKRVHFLVHGIHHDYPRDATRLVMPLLVSVPLATLFYFGFRYAFGVYHFGVFSGFVLGYVSYDTIHYATHHLKMKGKIGAFLKTYHLKHHYGDEHTAYGVSNPLWDYVFSTVPDRLKGEKAGSSTVAPK
jgi:sterol desaturase/sphingolipid hydroxylase (fatty acid hydroxylase superfamily)